MKLWSASVSITETATIEIIWEYAELAKHTEGLNLHFVGI